MFNAIPVSAVKKNFFFFPFSPSTFTFEQILMDFTSIWNYLASKILHTISVQLTLSFARGPIFCIYNIQKTCTALSATLFSTYTSVGMAYLKLSKSESFKAACCSCFRRKYSIRSLSCWWQAIFCRRSLHSQVTSTTVLQGVMGHLDFPWHGILHGCPHLRYTRVHDWLHLSPGTWQTSVNYTMQTGFVWMRITTNKAHIIGSFTLIYICSDIRCKQRH